MITGKKHPGQFEAVLSLLCLGAMIILTRFHSMDLFVYVAIMIILWAFSWGGAISALRHGDERGGLLGMLALVSVILANVIAATELLPALFARSGST
jgi:hypothetical protein